jgi:hypothetical protein
MTVQRRSKEGLRRRRAGAPFFPLNSIMSAEASFECSSHFKIFATGLNVRTICHGSQCTKYALKVRVAATFVMEELCSVARSKHTRPLARRIGRKGVGEGKGQGETTTTNFPIRPCISHDVSLTHPDKGEGGIDIWQGSRVKLAGIWL